MKIKKTLLAVALSTGFFTATGTHAAVQPAENYYSMTVTQPGNMLQDGQVFATYNGNSQVNQILTPTNWASVSFNSGSPTGGFYNPGTPSIFANALSSPGLRTTLSPGWNSSVAVGDLEYSFAVIAPAGGQANIPVILSGFVDQWIVGDAYAGAHAFVFGTDGAVVTSSGGYGEGSYQWFWCDGQSGAACNFSFTFSLNAKTYTADQMLAQSNLSSGRISLLAQANTNPRMYPCSLSEYGCTTGGNAHSFIDPYISIDPTFLASNPGYYIEVSSGIANNSSMVSSVPEPGTYAMLLAGLGLLCFTAKRRKQSA